jgi:hypothetical protein
MEYGQFESFETTTTTTAATTPATTTAATTTAATTPATTTTAATTTTTSSTPATTTSSTPATTTSSKPATSVVVAYYDSYGNRVYYDRYGKKYNLDINNPPSADIMYPPPYYDSYGNRVYYDSNGNKRNFDVNNPPKPSDIYPPPPVNNRDTIYDNRYNDNRYNDNRYNDNRYYRDNSGWNNWGWRSSPETKHEIDISLTRDSGNRGYYGGYGYNNQAISTSAGWSIFGLFVSILVLVWFIAGITAFFASFICLFYNGSVTDKTIGVLLGLFLGPFYWLYYIYNMNYCTKY